MVTEILTNEAENINFRPLEPGDLEMLHRWYQAPHVRPWFGGGRTFESIVEEYSDYFDADQPIHVYIVEYDGRPIGMLDWQRMGDFPEFQRTYEENDPDSINCDILIGEVDVVHRGLGVTILREFLRRIVFVDQRLTSCVIDPVPENAIAIRMYEKAGFRFVRALPEDGEGNAVYLMELSRDQLWKPLPPSPEFYIRPARVNEVSVAVDIDDDACVLYANAGLTMELDDEHPFVRAEVARWAEAAQQQRMLLACSAAGEPVGFAVLNFIDGKPHLDQLSVRRGWMKRGIGRALVDRAKAWSVRPGELWLTTYGARVPWNAPWYARMGFTQIAEENLGAEMKACIREER
ncbi:MAG TPA: GNAT family N-acetyltransferase, partial [Polyangium sp.]|nr:GNAT family N-acetyltransferase [Polyangium sp.]